MSTVKGHEHTTPTVPVITMLDYTGHLIEPIPVSEALAWPEEIEDSDAGVILSLCGTPEDPASHVDGGITWGYEVHLTVLGAQQLADQLASAAREAERRYIARENDLETLLTSD